MIREAALSLIVSIATIDTLFRVNLVLADSWKLLAPLYNLIKVARRFSCGDVGSRRTGDRHIVFALVDQVEPIVVLARAWVDTVHL